MVAHVFSNTVADVLFSVILMSVYCLSVCLSVTLCVYVGGLYCILWMSIDDKLCNVMELIEGATLAEHFASLSEKQRNFSESRIWNIFIQVCNRHFVI